MKLPSWNAVLAMHHWKRKKFKDQLAKDFLFALQATAKGLLMKTTSAKSMSLISCAIPASYLMTHLESAKSKSAKRRSAKASQRKR